MNSIPACCVRLKVGAISSTSIAIVFLVTRIWRWERKLVLLVTTDVDNIRLRRQGLSPLGSQIKPWVLPHGSYGNCQYLQSELAGQLYCNPVTLQNDLNKP